MIEQIIHESYDLIHNIDNTWTLKASKSTVYRGDLKTAVTYMVNKFFIPMAEIEIATEEMEIFDHNHAHFGGFRNFIFTSDKYTARGVA